MINLQAQIWTCHYKQKLLIFIIIVFAETGKVLLFVVNRDFDGGSGSAIEVFNFNKETHRLIHKESIKHPNIYW